MLACNVVARRCSGWQTPGYDSPTCHGRWRNDGQRSATSLRSNRRGGGLRRLYISQSPCHTIAAPTRQYRLELLSGSLGPSPERSTESGLRHNRNAFHKSRGARDWKDRRWPKIWLPWRERRPTYKPAGCGPITEKRNHRGAPLVIGIRVAIARPVGAKARNPGPAQVRNKRPPAVMVRRPTPRLRRHPGPSPRRHPEPLAIPERGPSNCSTRQPDISIRWVIGPGAVSS
jgi:hypothetical protein